MSALDVDVSGHAGAFAIDMSLSVGPGVTGLVGPSGSGKTSLLKMIAGVLRPERGYIRFAERTFFDADARISVAPEKRQIGMVFQDARLFPHMRVNGNLVYGAKARKFSIDPAEIDEVAQRLDIQGLLHRYPSKLSGGERQRVALGRAILSKPRLLLLDEPLTSVDKARRRIILPFTLEYCRSMSIDIVLASHEHDDIVRNCQNVIEVQEGRVRAFGPVEEFISALTKS